ncbi:phage holin family protein [Streptomyces sp. G45]|uniref:phage holin family protein n=1 Tax=Streptomyces sp. G45 TaxID=3406627 RepID=UPI003C255C72
MNYSTLASGSGATALIVIIGVALVVALLYLFWRGKRRVEQRPNPPQKPQPRSDSWDTPDSQDRD